MKRLSILIFGLIVYVMFLGVFIYSVGFVGNFLTPTRLDAAGSGPVTTALAIDVLLLLLFALQHSVMARPWFKAWLTKFVPVPMERSFYVLCTNVCLAVLFWQWQPLSGVVWNVSLPIGMLSLYVLFGLGWLTVLLTTFLIDHFDLFGLRQVWLNFRNRSYVPPNFAAPGPYRFVRHPMYIGWLMAFWATPTMTAAHLVFASGVTVYIMVAIIFEERDLLKALGRNYADYRENVPMLIPRIHSRVNTKGAATTKAASVQSAAFSESTVATHQSIG